jgi:DNA-binding transcriptional ArsR family regulator/rhodanese-related sulfurtransferase
MNINESILKKNNFKDQGYELISSVAGAMGNPHRLELLELLLNGPKSVLELAKEARLSLTNASAHLQKLKRYKLVKTQRKVNSIYYLLADESVLKLITALHKTAYSQLTELKHTIEHFRQEYGTDKAVLRELPHEDYILLDVRNREEYNHGHRQGAINIPHYQIGKSLDKLDKHKLIVAYCRGELCTLADEVVQQLNAAGFRAVRLEEIVLMKSA